MTNNIKKFEIIGYDKDGYLKLLKLAPGSILHLADYNIFPGNILLQYYTEDKQEINLRTDMNWFLEQILDGKIKEIEEIIEISDDDIQND